MEKLLSRNYSVFLLVFCLFSCDSNCLGEEEFYRLFSKSLALIEENYEKINSELSEEELRNYFFFLGQITGHPSSRVAGHFGVIYHKKEDYQFDVHKWEKWYDLNKNNYSMKEANKKFAQLPDNVKNGARNWCEFLGL